MKRIILSLAFAATMLSCAKEQETEQALPVDGSERVCASAADFVFDNELTKTVITQEGADAPKFAWKEGDVIGIIPMNGKTVQSNYEISEISSDPKEAMFDGGVWALKEGKEYAAYYPFKKEARLSNESIEFSFLGQTQAANNSLAHLGAYDYMYASSVVPYAGLATFQFKHLISLVRLQLTVPVSDTYKSVSLESDNAWFASKASLKLSDGTATGSDYLKNYTLNLNDISVSSGNVLTVWFAVLPTDVLKDNKLAIKVFSATDNLTGEISIPVEFKAGSAYSYSCVLESSGFVPEYVDLGLSVKWATCNLGATSIEGYGDYYAWGETETKSSYSNSTYKYYKSVEEYVEPVVDEDGFIIDPGGNKTVSGYTKYVPKSASESDGFKGFYDNKTTLDLEDDVAHVKYGGKWHMPTNADYKELIDNCSWQWVTYKDVKGYKVTSKKTGYTDKWIFLPATGYRSGTSTSSKGTYGYLWSSGLYDIGSSMAYYCYLYSGNYCRSNKDRYIGMAVRPVLFDISTHTHTLTKINGQAPTTASSGWKDYYQCSEPFCKLCFEDGEGKILIGDETALVAWKAVGGRGYLAPVSVTEPELVDLGLGVKWAAWNLGATKPEENGGYYQWAGLGDVTDTGIYLDWSNCPYHTGSNENTGWTKYIPSGKSYYWLGTGSPDNKTVLDPEDDIAHVTLGGNWRMPTDAEWEELINNCTWEWTNDYYGTGIAGEIVTSNKSGYTDKSIFLPAAGYRGYDELYCVGSNSYYWSSSLDSGYPYNAYYVLFNSVIVGRSNYYRSDGLSVRPVLT